VIAYPYTPEERHEPHRTRNTQGLFAVSLAVGATPLAAADIDPAIAAYILPKDIPWKKNPLNPGNEQAVLYGDPTSPATSTSCG